MEQLHAHNQKTYENICRMYNEGIQRVAVVQPTGSGKSLLMAKLVEDNLNSRFFVLSTRHEINEQFKEKLDDEMLKRSDFNIYCNMPNMKQEVMESLQPDYILLDEMHRALAREWSKGIMRLLEMYPNAKVLGLSATPIRYLDRCRNVAEELFCGNLACDMSLSQAILDGILPMARYVCGVYSYEKDAESLNKKIEKSTNSDEEKKEMLKELKILKENLDKGHGVTDIFRKYIVSGSEKFVVFLKDTTHLSVMKPVIEKWFTDAGFSVRLYEVHSKNVDSDKEFQAFKADTEDGIIKACLSVNMVAEGIHGDIDGVIMLRNTISANMYFQMIGRAFSCGKKTIPLIFDLVANSQFISDAADNFPNELRGEIEKRKREREKEGKEYEVGFDVNEFIVMDEFMDVVSGFRAIEGRLQGDWDVMFQEYCKFYEKNGHGDVPKTGEYRKLSNWCKDQRQNLSFGILKEERKKILNDNEFIWDVPKYRFEKQIIETKEFILKNGRYPKAGSDNKCESNLGNFISAERTKKRQAEKRGTLYPNWKLQIIDKEIPDFCWNPIEESFNLFLRFFVEYIKETGKRYVEKNVTFKGYKLGKQFGILKNSFDKGNIPDYKKEALMKLGVTFEDITDMRYRDNWKLLEKCVNDGIVLNSCNRKYENVDLYSWIKGTVKKHIEEGEKLSDRQKKLICKVLLWRKKVKVVDLKSSQVYVYSSANKASEALCRNFLIAKNAKSAVTTINNHLLGKTTAPYKGRFMFYYATDEEVKKYLEDGKVS